jgi:hypothetical protein
MIAEPIPWLPVAARSALCSTLKAPIWTQADAPSRISGRGGGDVSREIFSLGISDPGGSRAYDHEHSGSGIRQVVIQFERMQDRRRREDLSG